MMKTFCLLLLLCPFFDIGIAKPGKHFLIETDDGDGPGEGKDYESQPPKPGNWKIEDCEISELKSEPYCKCVSKCSGQQGLDLKVCQGDCNMATYPWFEKAQKQKQKQK